MPAMNDGLIDLHIHSNLSCDGDFSPEDLVGFAREKGFRAISIADHDTVGAYPAALEYGRDAGVEVIPSMEVTTLFSGREFHLLLPFVDWTSPAVASIVGHMTRTRLDEARERVKLLQGMGISITWDEVVKKSPAAPPLGVKIAQIVLEKPESRENPVLGQYYLNGNDLYAPYFFYRDFFMEGRLAYVPKKHIGLLEVLSMVPGTGAAPVLSHPGAYFQQTTRDDLVLLKEKGLLGMEVFTSYHSPEQVGVYSRLAEELDLVPTAGSDFHGKIKPHVAFGSRREGHYWMVEELKKRNAN
ncbi:MAG TPA: PHP domain-containing protein [Candidatus Aminicenantes bacterium]|nr:PHP domain-containing protein [Candidatus Aminicenantes bacterium]